MKDPKTLSNMYFLKAKYVRILLAKLIGGQYLIHPFPCPIKPLGVLDKVPNWGERTASSLSLYAQTFNKGLHLSVGKCSGTQWVSSGPSAYSHYCCCDVTLVRISLIRLHCGRLFRLLKWMITLHSNCGMFWLHIPTCHCRYVCVAFIENNR